jgi:capsular exopolysaccharide synthesis family protein
MSKSYEALQKAEAERRLGNVVAPDPVVTPPRNGKRSSAQGSDLDLAHLDPRIEEEYQKLRGNLFARPGKDGKEALRTVMVVGSAHGEGATTTSSILATLLAKTGTGEVALVDANLRTPSLHSVFSLDETKRGLTDLITNGFRPKDLVQPTAIPNLFVVPAGRPLPSPSSIYQEPIARLLSDLKTSFRYVMFDTSPVTDYSDASFLAPKVDGVVLVIRAESTRIDTAMKTKRQLEWAGGQVIGTVLNGKRSYIPLMIQRFL